MAITFLKKFHDQKATACFYIKENVNILSLNFGYENVLKNVIINPRICAEYH